MLAALQTAWDLEVTSCLKHPLQLVLREGRARPASMASPTCTGPRAQTQCTHFVRFHQVQMLHRWRPTVLHQTSALLLTTGIRYERGAVCRWLEGLRSRGASSDRGLMLYSRGFQHVSSGPVAPGRHQVSSSITYRLLPEMRVPPTRSSHCSVSRHRSSV